ncbi:MAG: hypothetical protein WC699_12625 [Bacteroidales bacterium]|jgi:photosystem II stability/assembly factor-like uncharacterized protein
MKKFISVLFLVTLSLTGINLTAQNLSQDVLSKIKYRSIGSTRHSGRFVDVAVYEKNPATFYAALASGGLWKTVNNGISFVPVFDEAGAISIGDIAMDQKNPDIIWVGTGEANNSRTAYYGDGIYKSTDGGKTWNNMGLKNSQHVGRIIIHPKNSDIVWVAAEGPLYSPKGDKGVFKTTDGGKSWKQVLKVTLDDREIGVVDLVMDPTNPDVFIAASYDKERKPWTFNAGGPGSALYKSTNGGSTWTKLAGGLPVGILGRIGVDISASNSKVVYANIENCNIDSISTDQRWEMMKNGIAPKRGQNEKGDEVYRSNDGGKTWKKVSPDGQSIGGGPAYYYQQVRIDPTNPEHFYIIGISVWETTNGGKDWKTAFRFGGDNHAMWIDSRDPKHFLLGYDHGLGITYDSGLNWYHPDFLAVGQFVAVGYDFDYPYNVYGGLQDNGSIKGPSTKRGGGAIKLEDWKTTGGGDGMYNVVDWDDSRWLYNESQNGSISRNDMETGESSYIQYAKMDRWAWNAPIVVSLHNSRTIYHGGNKVAKSTNRGDTWTEISPDLTTNDTANTHSTGNVPYFTIVTLEESYLEAGVLWAGTDDGKVWVTKNGGKDWNDLTANIKDHPGYWISRVEPSHFSSGTAYVTMTGLRHDDFRPFVFKTTDYGLTWTSIASNLPDEPVCVIREHFRNPQLLFAGTTKQVFVSIDGGNTWTSMRGNMPFVACEDLKIHPRENDLIVGTHGRSLWIADISYLENLTPEVIKSDFFLFKPETRIQWKGVSENNSSSSNFAGESEPGGVQVYYYSKDSVKDVVMRVFEGERLLYESKTSGGPGINQLTWNYQERVRELTAAEKEEIKKQAADRARAGGGRGAGRMGGGRFGRGQGADPNYLNTQTGPGEYTVKLSVGGNEQSAGITVLKDSWR